MTNVPMWKLNNGVEMPSLGYGVFMVEEGEAVYNGVLEALKSGYRLIDTAAAYGNEEGVGRAIKDSGLRRDEVFITTKVQNKDQGFDKTLEAFQTSLEKLGTDYIDLYLIHWPGKDLYVETYKAMEKLYKEGKVRAIGVCNFHIPHLQNLMMACEVKPAIDQIELHPLMNQKEIREFCKLMDIQVEAWGPLMQSKGDLAASVFQELSDKYQKTSAQIILRWHHQNGVIVIPKSVTPSRIKDNINIFDFELAPEDMEKINAYNQDKRLSSDPDTNMRGFL